MVRRLLFRFCIFLDWLITFISKERCIITICTHIWVTILSLRPQQTVIPLIMGCPCWLNTCSLPLPHVFAQPFLRSIISKAILRSYEWSSVDMRRQCVFSCALWILTSLLYDLTIGDEDYTGGADVIAEINQHIAPNKNCISAVRL